MTLLRLGACATLALTATVARAEAPAAASSSRELPTASSPFTPDVFHARRAHLMSLMKKGVGLILSMPNADLEEEVENLDFFYLTGIWDERNGGLMLDPAGAPEEREVLYLPAARPETDRYTGYRALMPNQSAEQRVGFHRIRGIEGAGRQFARLARLRKQLDYFGSTAAWDAPAPKILEIYQKTQQHLIGVETEDQHLLLQRMRMVKEPREVAKIQRATDITVAGHLEAMRRVRPGMHEWELKQILEDKFRQGGARQLSYPSIVGGGPDSCVLHYPNDDRVIEDGDLVLIDAGAEFDHYATDVTRTFPASGKFTPEQRRVYETVLAAQNAALAKLRPGATWGELQRLAEKVITDAGYYDYNIHGLGHHVGLQVHDVADLDLREPIAEGSVITIEPGIYIPEKKIGVRIEDTVLVTRSGPKLLSGALPRDPDAIERLMQSARR